MSRPVVSRDSSRSALPPLPLRDTSQKPTKLNVRLIGGQDGVVSREYHVITSETVEFMSAD